MKIKRIATNSPVALIGVAVGLLLLGCASTRIKRLSGSDFVNQAEHMKQVTSFDWTTYIGSSTQRAYLEFGYPAFVGKGARTKVYWTELSELPEDFANQLKAGKPPWKPWWTETNKTERTIEFTVTQVRLRCALTGTVNRDVVIIE